MKRIAYRFFLIVLLSVLAVEVFPVSAQEGSWFDEGNYDEEDCKYRTIIVYG